MSSVRAKTHHGRFHATVATCHTAHEPGLAIVVTVTEKDTGHERHARSFIHEFECIKPAAKAHETLESAWRRIVTERLTMLFRLACAEKFEPAIAEWLGEFTCERQ